MTLCPLNWKCALRALKVHSWFIYLSHLRFIQSEPGRSLRLYKLLTRLTSLKRERHAGSKECWRTQNRWLTEGRISPVTACLYGAVLCCAMYLFPIQKDIKALLRKWLVDTRIEVRKVVFQVLRWSLIRYHMLSSLLSQLCEELNVNTQWRLSNRKTILISAEQKLDKEQSRVVKSATLRQA